MSYWACVVARNAAEYLSTTVDSILNQTLEPKLIVIVNDGSSDATADTLKRYQTQHRELLSVINRPDFGYDIRRVPLNINLACREAESKGVKTGFFMISGDDCAYPENYIVWLTERMKSEPRIVVASGKPSSNLGPRQEHSPSGSGRIVSWSFWNEIGGKYPLKAGWETWLLYKAQERNLGTKLFEELVFHHARPRGAKHQFAYWGAAMHTLGYHPLYAFGRLAKNALGKSISVKGSLNMIRGYMQARLGASDPFLLPFEQSFRKFIRKQQAREMSNRIMALSFGR